MIRPNDECSPRLEGATPRQREREREIDACLHLGIYIPVFIAHRQRQGQTQRRNRKHSRSESGRDNGHSLWTRRSCPCANEVRALDLKIIISAAREAEREREGEWSRAGCSPCVASRQQDPDWPTSALARTAGPTPAESETLEAGSDCDSNCSTCVARYTERKSELQT